MRKKALLDTTGGNTKLAKGMKDELIRIAGLSLQPNKKLCPMQDIADCKRACLYFSGRGHMQNVINARREKTEYLENYRSEFIDQLCGELHKFEKLCKRTNVKPYVRLNVLSDVQWELPAYGSIPDTFPDLNFYDYTKLSKRLTKTPKNYQLMFSYSKASAYQKYVQEALETNVPMSVVFSDDNFPTDFLGRPVHNGDDSDILNLEKYGEINGLKYKNPNGQGIDPLDVELVVDTNLIAIAA
tara:strand:- start:1197 stop:1922 length:726 start_codon:yes stop_codon:yes gene_type:complete